MLDWFPTARGARLRGARRVSARSRGGWLVLVVALGLLVGGRPLPAAATVAPEGLADVLPAERAAVRAATEDELAVYTMDVVLDPDAGSLSGVAEVRYRNPARTALDEVYFRAFPNAAYYGEGELTVERATVGGRPVVPVWEEEGTALRLPLAEPLVPGGEAAVSLAFTTRVPVDSEGSYGIFQRDTEDGTWVLADWHPVLAVYEEGAGWVLDPVTSFGDPTYAASAWYDVTVAAPAGLALVASGVAVGEEARGELVARRFVAGPAREFTLVADDDYRAVAAEAGGTTVTAYVEPEEPGAVAAGEAAVAVAVEALGVYGERFGPYPYAELDLVQTPLNGALAVSWSGIVFLDGGSLLADYDPAAATGFETVVAHEVAHLWWGAIVGSNSNRHTFVNEGLATFSSLVYQEAVAGVEVAAAERGAWVIGPARSLLARGDAIADVPIAEGQDPSERAWAAYGKGALGFLAIRSEIGDDAFFAGLRSFAEAYRFGIAEPEDLLAAFEAAAGEDLDALWGRWFEEAALTEAEIAALE